MGAFDSVHLPRTLASQCTGTPLPPDDYYIKGVPAFYFHKKFGRADLIALVEEAEDLQLENIYVPHKNPTNGSARIPAWYARAWLTQHPTADFTPYGVAP